MATQESTILYFDENNPREWPKLIPAASLDEVPTPYFHDLKNTLEFDRKCRSLEKFFADLQNRINAVEMEITKVKRKA